MARGARPGEVVEAISTTFYTRGKYSVPNGVHRLWIRERIMSSYNVAKQVSTQRSGIISRVNPIAKECWSLVFSRDQLIYGSIGATCQFATMQQRQARFIRSSPDSFLTTGAQRINPDISFTGITSWVIANLLSRWWLQPYYFVGVFID